ncbi:MAG: zinc-dependent metalloprotease [Armatimonadetes bacterium]|nr:zinc-dependent metalloprotease [Armatimonadota bacterium]
MLSLIALANIFNSDFADSDHDGLLDKWEINGFGPLNPKTMGCKPDHADIVIVYCLRSNMTQAKIQPTIDRMKKFYASMPYKNPDGTIGLNLIPIVTAPNPADTDKINYPEMYERAFPLEWRGLAHGAMVDSNPNGGGQSNRPDWAGLGTHWATFVHEVGHQLGLPHDPLGAKTGSPYHRSLMNYDYSYQLGGNGEAIIFSDGKFASLKMKETDLNERIPFPLADLDFLAKRPYFFAMKAVDAKHTDVDWNRNGIFGQNHVRADINDGYSIGLPSTINLEKVGGAPSMVALGNKLIVLEAVGTGKMADASLSKASQGKLQVQIVEKGQAGKPIEIASSGICGDISAVEYRGSIFVSYATETGLIALEFKLKGGQLVLQSRSTLKGENLVPTLVVTDNGVGVLVWNSVSKAINYYYYQKIKLADGKSLGLESQQPVGAVWNPKRKSLAVASVVNQTKLDGCIKITHFDKDLKASEPLWVGNDHGGSRTSGRPILLVDSSRDGGKLGSYTVYVKGFYDTANQPGLNFSCRQISEGEGWRIKMMGNEWANSRSVCAVTPYMKDVAYAYRWFSGDADNSIWLTLKASGIEDKVVTDFDEVKFIFEHGLQNSLHEVQKEQWMKH